MVRLSSLLRRVWLTSIAVLCVSVLTGADWRQFRGNDLSGVADDSNPPVEWDRHGKRRLEERAFPGAVSPGRSSSAIWVIVTASSGYRQGPLAHFVFR